jgi:nucleotide-binding universal stress UspA family protein
VDSSYRAVLVGTDGSESSYHAVERAAAIARDSQATLYVACAYRPMPERERTKAADALGDEAYKVMGSHPADDVARDGAERAKKVGATDIQIKTVEGDPVDSLVDLIGRTKAELLVVGNRGLNSLAGRLLGSVPANVSHRAACDVLIVHTTGGRRS